MVPSSNINSKSAGSGLFAPDLPRIEPEQKIAMRDVRASGESAYLRIIWLANILIAVTIVLLIWQVPDSIPVLAVLIGYGLLGWLAAWIGWKLTIAFLEGHCIEVGPRQFPQIYAVVKQASEALEIPAPRVFIMQGHGMFEIFVAKRFSRRGHIFITSNLIDEFADKPTSRAFMMYIGRQLGHIKAGHFDKFFFKNILGATTLWFWLAWRRRCHLTADRIGLLCAGNLYDAEQALFIITVGRELAPGASLDSVAEQARRNSRGFWSWLRVRFSLFPYMVDRMVELRDFALALGVETGSSTPPAVGALPISHGSLRALPILVIHGHDETASLRLQTLLYSKFPQVVPRVMVSEQLGTLGMSEKFDAIAGDVAGAIALLTPDDRGASLREADKSNERARQNVVMEIGWAWGKLGREKCLLLKRGNVELPSDLSGVDVETFDDSPAECVVSVYNFVEHLITTEARR